MKLTYDTRLDSLSSDMKQMQHSIQQLTKQVNDMRFIMTEERKNDDAKDELKKQIYLLQQSVNVLTTQSLSKQQGTKPDSAMEKWLKEVVKLPQYIPLFNENGLEDLETVKHLTQKELEIIGVDKFGHKLKIYKEIEKLNAQNTNETVPQYEGGTAYI